MTLRKIHQLANLVEKLPNRPRYLNFVNAYTDQALMNFSYETMTREQQVIALALIRQMIGKFNKIRGR